jgi:hypothetical protein
MSNPPEMNSSLVKMNENVNSIAEAIKMQSDPTLVMALLELLKIEDRKITIVGEPHTVSNLELITEYPNANYTRFMVKNETWRQSCKEVFHLKSVDEEKIVGFQDMQIMLKMISHKRKRAQEYVNGMKRESANMEIIPQNTKAKRWFGMGGK